MAAIEVLRQVNAASPFNSWAAFQLVSADGGEAELAVDARPEVLRQAGLLHAGVLGAMIDTSCGFAAATVAGNVLASQYQVMCYACDRRPVRRASQGAQGGQTAGFRYCGTVRTE